MNTKHAPGPWAIERPYAEPGVYVGAADTSLVCRICMDGAEANDPEGLANARLIAAAPDMYTALAEMIRFASQATPEQRSAVAMACDALRKAEGRS